MKLIINPPAKSLSKAYLKQSLKREQIELFKTNLARMFERIRTDEHEEHLKNIVSDFLKDTWYKQTNEINTSGRADLAIHNGTNSTTSVGVLIEVKRPTNKNEMISPERPNVKALHELLHYYMQERYIKDNKEIRHLDHSLNPIPQELNELDWKEEISPDKVKLSRHLSAFANQPGGGFMVFGIEDKPNRLVGVNQLTAENIVQRLGNLCRDSLNPLVTIDHAIENYQDVPLLFVHIRESAVKPVHLKSGTMEDAYIRSGGSTRKASRQEIGGLMLNSKTPQFEELHASKLKQAPETLDILDYRSIYKLLGKPVPQSNDEVLQWMKDEKMLDEVDGAGYYITNFGALAAAQNLKDFDGLARKSIRLIKYKGINKLEAEKEFPGSKGYAIGFEGLIAFIKAMLPSSEIIRNALRAETTVYPEIAIRELVANALIHQDFSIRGSGPMIEIFADRIEISNPGKLLPSKKIDRLIRTTPESRNEILAAAFRRYNICEERGSGFEKAVAAIELYGLPPLKFEELENSFRVTLYCPKTFAELTPMERIEACYQHSIIKYYSSGGMTNTSLRERFKMHEKQRPQVSLVIKEALAQGKIKPKDPNNVSTKFAEYIPGWG